MVTGNLTSLSGHVDFHGNRALNSIPETYPILENTVNSASLDRLLSLTLQTLNRIFRTTGLSTQFPLPVFEIEKFCKNRKFSATNEFIERIPDIAELK